MLNSAFAPPVEHAFGPMALRWKPRVRMHDLLALLKVRTMHAVLITLLLVTQGIGDVADIYRTANQSNVAVYPIDPRGLGMSAGHGAEDWLRVLADETRTVWDALGTSGARGAGRTADTLDRLATTLDRLDVLLDDERRVAGG